MPSERLSYLFARYLEKSCSPNEKFELSELSLMDEHRAQLRDLMEVAWDRPYDFQGMPAASEEETLRKIFNGYRAKVSRLWIRRIAVAAITTGVLFAGYEFFFRKPAKTAQMPENAKAVVIPPGTNKAVLTLGNGATIILDSISTGAVARQGNMVIVKTGSGGLTYSGDSKTPAEILSNTLSTPRGGQFQLILPDGTRVWLNAASSITYPTAFAGKERLVSVTGEAYFEVVHDAGMPFRVKVGDQTIEDVGTAFNINAYPEEDAIKVTLIEGEVNVRTKKNSRRMSPNEQALIRDGRIDILKDVDVERVVAWKRGLFQFNQTSLPVIMRQISRWYDVDIKYEGTVSEATFGGGISRNLPLSSVLKLLEANGVVFRLEGKELFVDYNPK